MFGKNLWKIWILLFAGFTCFSILDRVFNFSGNVEPVFNVIDKSHEEIFNRDADLIIDTNKRDQICLIDDYSYCFCDEVYNVIFYDKFNNDINSGRLIEIVNKEQDIYKDININNNIHEIINGEINNELKLEFKPSSIKDRFKSFFRKLSGQSIIIVCINSQIKPEIALLTREYDIKLYIMYNKGNENKNYKYIIHGLIEMDNDINGMNLFYVADGKVKNYEKVNKIKFNGIMTLNDKDKELVSYIALNNRLNKVD
jgi:hypothetical protein